MKHLLEVRVQVACLVALFSLQLAAGLLDGAWIKGTTDKSPLSYKAGEEIAFTLEPMGVEGEIPDGEYFLAWKRSDDFGGSESGEVPFPRVPSCTGQNWTSRVLCVSRRM